MAHTPVFSFIRPHHLAVLVLVFPPLIVFFLNLVFPLPIENLTPEPSVRVFDRNHHLMRAYTTSAGRWHFPESLDEVSPNLVLATLAYEDRWFYRHWGINPFALMRALTVNVQAGKIVMGGSTLTMQIARMVEPKERTVPNKLIEMFRALQLEWHFSKPELLRLYFNLAPYGGNLVGSGAAARFYFGKPQAQLSLGEAALLAIIPNSPNQWRPDRFPQESQARRDLLLHQLHTRRKITTKQLNEALSESVPATRQNLPFFAPHLADYLRQTFPREHTFQTTIDPQMQHLAQSTLNRYLLPLRAKEIYQGAVVIIDVPSREVRALVGSFDFFETAHEGQVNGALAPRSPGSTLKPFLYGLALHQGRITPETRLADVPVDYAGYSPVNYDEQFSGWVPVHQALARSLNVPAVNLYAQMRGGDGLYSFLKAAGIRTLTEPETHYGLSLILGACEVNLLEMTNLYAGLAHQGQFGEYHLLKKDPTDVQRPLTAGVELDPGACFILTEMLTELERPDMPATWQKTVDLPKVAWKTGTSYGHKDAWSIGYSPRYAIGVWVGNFDGQGAPELTGGEAAAPILFALFNAVAQEDQIDWFEAPPAVAQRQVCSLSGMVPHEYCPTTQTEFYLPAVSPRKPCTVHLGISVDDQTGYRLCSVCRVNRAYHRETRIELPPEVATWLERRGYPLEPLPEHLPICTAIPAGQAPIIRSPSADVDYIIRQGVDRKYQQILLEASVSNRTRKIYWFLDQELIFSGLPTEPVFITPEKGIHTLVCMDDESRRTTMTFRVK
ncbi:MAG: penicillin-binding protein 1C [Gemmatimonadetes bacterium]|nr:MAG: penicillin-binding protein 1C [Gemmatimonadota bacterium]